MLLGKDHKRIWIWAPSSPAPAVCHWRSWSRASPFLQFHLMSLTPSLKCLFQQHHAHYLLQNTGCLKYRGPVGTSDVFTCFCQDIHATNLWIFGEPYGPTTPGCILNFSTLFLAILINTSHIMCSRVQGNGIKSLESNLTSRAVCQET